MQTVKKRSQKQERSVAKDFNAKVTVASGALCNDITQLEVSGNIISIDTEDLPLVSQYYLKIPKGSKYVIAREPMKNGSRKSISLSRLLLGVFDTNLLVDHKDRDTFNYCKSNLRVCTRSQNQANRVFPKHTSKYKGVSYDTKLQKWKVSIKYDRQNIHGGYFCDEDEAGRKYNELALKYFGDFAVLNDIGGEE